MLSKLTTAPPPLIFIDTLYHFQETLELKDEVARRYGVHVHVFKPLGCETAQDFEKLYGEKLWDKDEATYDYAAKVSFPLHVPTDIFLLKIRSHFPRLNLHAEHMRR